MNVNWFTFLCAVLRLILLLTVVALFMVFVVEIVLNVTKLTFLCCFCVWMWFVSVHFFIFSLLTLDFIASLHCCACRNGKLFAILSLLIVAECFDSFSICINKSFYCVIKILYNSAIVITTLVICFILRKIELLHWLQLLYYMLVA